MNKSFIYILLLLSLNFVCSIVYSSQKNNPAVQSTNFCVLFGHNSNPVELKVGGDWGGAVIMPAKDRARAISCDLWIDKEEIYLKLANDSLIPALLTLQQQATLRRLKKKNNFSQVLASRKVDRVTEIYSVQIPLCIFPYKIPKVINIVTEKPKNHTNVYTAQLTIGVGGRYTINYDILASKQELFDTCNFHHFNTISRPFTQSQIDALSKFQENMTGNLFLVTHKKGKKYCFEITKITGRPEDLRQTPEIEIHVNLVEEASDKYTCIENVKLKIEDSGHYLLYEMNGQQRKDKICNHTGLTKERLRSIELLPRYLVDENKKMTWCLEKITHSPQNQKDAPAESFSFSHQMVIVGGIGCFAALALILYYHKNISQFISGYFN